MTQPTSTLPPISGSDPNWAPPGWAPPTPPTPPASRLPVFRGSTGKFVIAAIVLFFIVAGIAGSGDKKDTSSAGTVATTPTTAAPAAGTRATTAATSAPSAVAAATVSVASWSGRYGSPDMDVIVEDLNALQADAEATDLSGMLSSCRTFQRHIATAESHLPTPDAQLTSALGGAYGSFDQAMTACISGATTGDIDDLTAMTTYISQATSSIHRAKARVDALS